MKMVWDAATLPSLMYHKPKWYKIKWVEYRGNTCVQDIDQQILYCLVRVAYEY